MEAKVIIPDEFISVIEFRQEDFLGIAEINTALRTFDSRLVFPWHLSILIELKAIDDDGLPTEEERTQIDKLEDELDSIVKGEDTLRPNALFLARIEWNGTIEFIWRLHTPSNANLYLTELLEKKSYQRPFDFRIDHDNEWTLTQWHLQDHSQ